MYFLKPISLLISGAVYTTCFVLLTHAPEPTKKVMVTQFGLWGLAMFTEVAGHAFTPDDSKEVLRGSGSLTARLSTLTVIVMGEGLSARSSPFPASNVYCE
jgi:hypothetical protein